LVCDDSPTISVGFFWSGVTSHSGVGADSCTIKKCPGLASLGPSYAFFPLLRPAYEPCELQKCESSNFSVFVCLRMPLEPCAWIPDSEIFPLGARAKGVSIGASSNWLNNIAMGMATSDILAEMKVRNLDFRWIVLCLWRCVHWILCTSRKTHHSNNSVE
jgi:hypothetical protein